MKVFVVMGETGEYSDRNEWSVCAYTDEDQAKQHVTLASEQARLIKVKYGSQWWKYNNDEPRNAYDSDMQMSYTGTSYYYLTVDVFGSTDEYVAALATDDRRITP